MIAMLSDVIRYSGSYAKVRTMAGKLLSDEDYDALLAKTTVGDVAAYLKNNTEYHDALKNISETDIHRGELEGILQEEKDKASVKLFKYEKGINANFYQVFVIRYEIELLKEMLRLLENDMLHTFKSSINPYYKKHMSYDAQRLALSRSAGQFADNLYGSPYYDIITRFIANREHLDIFNLEMTLDVHYFTRAWKLIRRNLRGRDQRIVSESFGTEIDILNIMWILRCKKYFGTPKELIYAFVIPYRYRLSRETLVALVEAGSVEELYAVLEKHPYKQVFADDALFTEQYFYQYVHKMHKKMSVLMPYSVMTTIAYIHAKETEINNIVKIIEGIRYKMDMKEIEKYLIRQGR